MCFAWDPDQGTQPRQDASAVLDPLSAALKEQLKLKGTYCRHFAHGATRRCRMDDETREHAANAALHEPEEAWGVERRILKRRKDRAERKLKTVKGVIKFKVSTYDGTVSKLKKKIKKLGRKVPMLRSLRRQTTTLSRRADVLKWRLEILLEERVREVHRLNLCRRIDDLDDDINKMRAAESIARTVADAKPSLRRAFRHWASETNKKEAAASIAHIVLDNRLRRAFRHWRDAYPCSALPMVEVKGRELERAEAEYAIRQAKADLKLQGIGKPKYFTVRKKRRKDVDRAAAAAAPTSAEPVTPDRVPPVASPDIAENNGAVAPPVDPVADRPVAPSSVDDCLERPETPAVQCRCPICPDGGWEETKADDHAVVTRLHPRDMALLRQVHDLETDLDADAAVRCARCFRRFGRAPGPLTVESAFYRLIENVQASPVREAKLLGGARTRQHLGRGRGRGRGGRGSRGRGGGRRQMTAHEQDLERDRREASEAAQRARAAARQRDHRRRQTEAERDDRRDANRLRNVQARANETADQADARRREDAARTNAGLQHASSRRIRGTVGIAGQRTIDNFDPSSVEKSNLGRMCHVCQHCRAMYWSKETNSQGVYTGCCSNGGVDLPSIPLPSEEIQSLYAGETRNSKEFLNKIRAYNSAVNFASVKMNDERPFGRNGQRCPISALRISGQVTMRMGDLYPDADRSPCDAQLYVLDSEMQLQQRVNRWRLNGDVMRTLQEYIISNNRLHNEFVQFHHYMRENNLRPAETSLIFYAEPREGVHERQANAPTAAEVAFVYTGDPRDVAKTRDIVVKGRDGGPLLNISVNHPLRDALHYTALFPDGQTEGYHINIPRAIESADGGSKRRVSPKDFYAFRLQVRASEWRDEDDMQVDEEALPTREFSLLHRAQGLFHEYSLDAYIKMEDNRLEWCRFNQTVLRSACYGGAEDSVNHDNESDIGRFVLLPSTFKGGPREMQAAYQDAMAIVREYGKPDFFITFTCNPNWDEIRNELEHGQAAKDRPDLVCRVFHMKFKELMRDIFDNGILGRAVAYSYSIEFQKRGLPHAHILLILERGSKIAADDIDKFVCAEIPDPNTQPELYAIVTNNLIHKPCGQHDGRAPCMKNGMCSKNFPKEFAERTTVPADGYPKYRRRSPDQGGHTFTKTIGGVQHVIDNRWVVPYNPYLALKYNAHINVEFCASVKSVKYIHKYIFKGHDEATIEVQGQDRRNRDEIEAFLNGRYMSSTEAIW